jgi:hypothetical protein
MVLYEEQREIDYTYEQTIRIIHCMSVDDYHGMLNETDILLNCFDDEQIKVLGLSFLAKKISGLLVDEKWMRLVSLLQKIKAEVDTGIEYFDDDRGLDERLIYRPKLEKELLELKRDIRKAISNILKKKKEMEL